MKVYEIYFSSIKGFFCFAIIYLSLWVFLVLSVYIEGWYFFSKAIVFCIDYYVIVQIFVLLFLFFRIKPSTSKKIGWAISAIPFFVGMVYYSEKEIPMVNLQKQTKEEVYFINLPQAVKDITIKRYRREFGVKSLFSTGEDSLIYKSNRLQHGVYNFVKKGFTKEIYINGIWYTVASDYSDFYKVDLRDNSPD